MSPPSGLRDASLEGAAWESFIPLTIESTLFPFCCAATTSPAETAKTLKRIKMYFLRMKFSFKKIRWKPVILAV
jgi:hypothetical protein